MEPTEPAKNENRGGSDKSGGNSGNGGSRFTNSADASTETTGRGIGEVPLFPLEMVLFPFVPQRFHIFEDRYRKMITRCVRESIPFGIVRVLDYAPDGSVRTSEVGCLARIVRVERLPDGRMNIEVVGEGRFRILDTHEHQPYRVGLTEPVSDDAYEPAELRHAARALEVVLREFLGRKFNLTHQDLPDDPLHLGFLAAWILPGGDDEKQEILAMVDAPARLLRLRDIFESEVEELRQIAEKETRDLKWEPIELSRFDSHRSVN